MYKMHNILIALLGSAAVLSGAPALAATTAAVVDFTSCAKPEYPAAALAESRIGTVTMAFLIDTSGTAVDSRVEKSSKHADLDQAALDAIKLCKFVPGTKDGKPSQSWMKMQYVWSLK